MSKIWSLFANLRLKDNAQKIVAPALAWASKTVMGCKRTAVLAAIAAVRHPVLTTGIATGTADVIVQTVGRDWRVCIR